MHFISKILTALLCILLAASPAGSGSMTLLGVGPPPVAAGGGFSLTFQSITQSTATTTTVNYGTMTYGVGNTAVIIAIATFASSPTVTAVSVNGVAATAISGATAGANQVAALWQSNTAVSGSSGTVSVTYSAAPLSRSAVALFNLVTTTPTASAAQVNSTTNATTISAPALTVPVGGGAIAFSNTYGGVGGNPTASLTNATLDNSLNNGTSLDVIPLAGHTTTTGSVTVSSNSTVSTAISLVAAAWSP